MRVVSIVGARPQFVKLKPVDDALNARDLQHQVLHTGQHYDARMSQAFFDGLHLPDPTWNLEVGSGPHGQQTARMLDGIEAILRQDPPDWVLVYGDTNSTLAGALASAKLHIPLAHVEAGLRSRNRAMPEEINRVATDHVSDLLFAPTQIAADNLALEGLADRSTITGDVMADLLLSLADEIRARPSIGIDVREPYVVATIHRESNTDDVGQLTRLIRSLGEVPARVLLIAHPRLVKSVQSAGVSLECGNMSVQEPLPYLDMLRLVSHAAGLVTDSGGLQKEAFLLGVPCTTLRTETEWVETLEGGCNILDPTGARLRLLAIRNVEAPASAPFGDGHAAARIASILAAG